MSKKIRFSKAKEFDFYSTLNKRVDEYFIFNKISKNANWVMVFKTFFILGICTAAYLLLILNANSLADAICVVGHHRILHGFYWAQYLS